MEQRKGNGGPPVGTPSNGFRIDLFFDQREFPLIHLLPGNLPLGVVIIYTFGFGVLFSVCCYFELKRSSAVVLGVAAKSGPPMLFASRQTLPNLSHVAAWGRCKKQKDEATLSLPSNIPV